MTGTRATATASRSRSATRLPPCRRARTPPSPPAPPLAAGLVQRPGQSRQLDRHRRLRRRLAHPAVAAAGHRSQLPAPSHLHQRGPVHAHRHRHRRRRRRRQRHRHRHRRGTTVVRRSIDRAIGRTRPGARRRHPRVYADRVERRPHRGGRCHGDGRAAGRCRLRFGDVDPWRLLAVLRRRDVHLRVAPERCDGLADDHGDAGSAGDDHEFGFCSGLGAVRSGHLEQCRDNVDDGERCRRPRADEDRDTEPGAGRSVARLRPDRDEQRPEHGHRRHGHRSSAGNCELRGGECVARRVFRNDDDHLQPRRPRRRARKQRSRSR